MSPEFFEGGSLLVGAILTLGTFAVYLLRRRFGKPELAFMFFGAVLIALPIIRHLKIKTKDTEIEIDRLQRQVAHLQRNVHDVAQVQDKIVDLQQASAKIAVAPPKDRQAEFADVFSRLQTLDAQASRVAENAKPTY